MEGGRIQKMNPDKKTKTLTEAEAYQAIVKHGLSVRKIPDVVISICHPRHFREGTTDEIVQWKGQEACQRKTTPRNAGHWMCQLSGGTSETQYWSTKTCYLAPTLAESVQLYLDSMEEASE